MRISDWISDLCSSYLAAQLHVRQRQSQVEQTGRRHLDIVRDLLARVKGGIARTAELVRICVERIGVRVVDQTTQIRPAEAREPHVEIDRKSTRLNSSH